jgi:hypothetical protein
MSTFAPHYENAMRVHEGIGRQKSIVRGGAGGVGVGYGREAGMSGGISRVEYELEHAQKINTIISEHEIK